MAHARGRRRQPLQRTGLRRRLDEVCDQQKSRPTKPGDKFSRKVSQILPNLVINFLVLGIFTT